jgi:isochorismate synthase
LHTDINLFFGKIEKYYASNRPFVVYKKPNSELVSAYIQSTKEVYDLKTFTETGFVFAPFNDASKKIIFPKDKCLWLSTLTGPHHELQEANENNSFKGFSKTQAKKDHIELVQKTIDFIRNNQAEKIVISRKEMLEYSNFNPINVLKRMLNGYSNAFVYLWFHPVVGLWLGATPERLIRVGQGNFNTMALAGTQNYKGSTEVDWNDKELHEQQLVTDFILEKIEGYIEEIKIDGPYSVRAGNLLHLRTDISGNLQSTVLLKNLINSLYPTPAICGLPKRDASKFILQNEGYDRSFYTGFLGELNIDGSTNLFVNLRCMQLENNYCSIYVGGGITKDSDPFREWEETVVKAEVIKKVL